MAKAVFIDRDGTINEEVNYLNDHAKMLLMEKSVEGLQLLQKNGYKIIIVTNQSGIAKGKITEVQLEQIHGKIRKALTLKHGIVFEEIFVCPHSSEDNCDCRKPKTKSIEESKKKYGLKLEECYVVGDKTSDVEMGKRAGCKTVLLKTGYGGKDGKYSAVPDFVAENLFEAAKIITKKGE